MRSAAVIRALKSAARIFAGLWILSLALLFFAQERLIFHPEKLAKDYRFEFNMPFEESYLDLEGDQIHTLTFNPPAAPGRILFFHGNAGSMESWSEAAYEIAARTGWSVAAIDYPGYGKSDGAIHSEEQLHAMAKVFLAKNRTSFDKLVFYGRSIGSGLAVKLAAENPTAGLVLESPYYGLRELAGVIAPWAPLFAMKYNLPSYKWLPDVKSPVLIVHGDKDEVIPRSQGERLAKLGKEVTFVTIPGGFHNDLADHDLYWNSLIQFLSRL